MGGLVGGLTFTSRSGNRPHCDHQQLQGGRLERVSVTGRCRDPVVRIRRSALWWEVAAGSDRGDHRWTRDYGNLIFRLGTDRSVSPGMSTSDETPQPTIIQQLSVRKPYVSSPADKQQTDERQDTAVSFREEEFLQQHFDAVAALPTHNLSIDEAISYVFSHDSQSRMGAVLDLRDQMSYSKWLTVLGEAWTECDNIRDYSASLRRLLGTTGPLLPMMNAEDRTGYKDLPDRVTVYRGCSETHMRGASWSLDQQVARKFPFLAGYRVSYPVLVTATVRKEHVLAVFLAREEQEIVSFKARRVSVERLEKER
jgi:hypothetical protein